jgi:hypothetical protein
MAWKPKTIAGKILKGAVIAGGSVLGLAVGAKVVTAIPGIIKKGVTAVQGLSKKGTTALAKTESVLSDVTARVDQVSASASNLLAGVTQSTRDAVAAIKGESQQAIETLKTKPGVTTSSMGGFLNSINPIYIIGAVIAGLFLFSKKLR